MSNYPDGAVNDPRAPWNLKESLEWSPVGEGQCCICDKEKIVDVTCICKDCFEIELEDEDYDSF